MLKTCTVCNLELGVENFNKRSRSIDGLNSSCKSCRSAQRKTYQSQKGYNKKYREDNLEFHNQRLKNWRQDNKEHIKLYKKTYETLNRAATLAGWRTKDIKRRGRTPNWLSKDQIKAIQNFYWLAKDLEVITGERYQVDHIVPLNGKIVCGLHVPWNLQVLPADLNLKKSNSFEQGFSANTGGGINGPT